MRNRMKLARAAIFAVLLAGFGFPKETAAQKTYGPGVTDTEIKIGQTAPYSGPASAFSRIHKAEASYFKYLNSKGGINGRMVQLISYDDGFSPPKAVEQVRRLVEQDEVAAIFSLLGTAINVSVRKYLNSQKVPQIFAAAQSSSLADPEQFPWTLGLQPTLRFEGTFYGKYVAEKSPSAKVAVIYQNDDFGKDLLRGLKEGIGSERSGAISEQSFDATVPTVDSQIVTLAVSRPDILFIFAYPKNAAQAIKKAHELGWKPTIYMFSGSGSIAATLRPAGIEASLGVIRTAHFKDPTDPRWKDDPEMIAWLEYAKEFTPEADVEDYYNSSGFAFAKVLEHVLRQCGDNLTRENIMKQALALQNLPLPLGLPGALINTSPTNYEPMQFMELQKFDGTAWKPMDR
jgi:branched-chain amino acid transport system substrate-binding protein